VQAWDLAVRVLHWALALGVALDFVYDDGGALHRAVGYAAAGIVVLRLSWAAMTRGHARLATLRPSPRGTLVYLRLLQRGRAPRHPGHDPLGLWMVWLLWLLVLLLGVTGWMSRLDAFWGDDLLHDLHAWLADALLVAVFAHLIGVAVMSWAWHENLPVAMITGSKRAVDSSDRD
jgi:cytochrome b